jgi:hypothetical protein
MQMIDVLKRLAELDENNPNVVNPMVKEAAKVSEAPTALTENAEIKLPEMPDPGLADLKALSGVKKLNESTIAECGMPTMGAPMPPTMPASINMSAGNANEIVAMVRGIMDLAKTDVPSQTMAPTMGAPMPSFAANAMGDVDGDGDHDMRDHDLEQPDPGPLSADPSPAVSGPTFGDDAGANDSGDAELADMLKKISTGEPVKIKTDMPVKVTSDEPIKGTTDSLNKVGGDGPKQKEETYDNSPKEKTRDYNPNDFANIINKVRDFDYVPSGSGSNPMPEEGKKKEENADPLAAFEAKLFDEYKNFVAEAPNKSQIPAYKRKEKGGDWKVSQKDLDDEASQSPTSKAGLEKLKKKLGQ